ncbi:flagellar basal-body MS-ring/collar protein FliF [Thermosulfurimonas sp. F29]|uniref:flagellar basal-body MS-ring/collar protein FliF n=1 Tax=Thermosulfurimonas sp. F29 TaxID=2867247 RepID=UPI001C82C6B5|nr:flagellar basal-body MS-ring/collar protein FliF [Thermosulfurimonas sp. F29]MBX6423057.1 flagellar M-ring protein FliF [Thermosulfurimonas sp. F29]
MKWPQPREVVGQLRTFYEGLNRQQKIIGSILLLLAVAGFAALILWSSRPEWALLYRGLPEETAGEIVNYLKNKNIPYRIGPGGSIKVPKDKVLELRMEIAGQGLVGGPGPGFELFDKGRIGATEFVQRVNYQRALEGELARTIMSLREVKYARVHLALPRESLFVEEEKPPKASVFVSLRPGYTLTRKEILGIVNLVSGAVTGLTPENISIIDSTGRILYRGKKEEEEVSATQLAYQRSLEERYRSKIEDLLSRALGPGRAVAQVSVEVDFDKGAIREETYDPEMTAVVSESVEESSKSSRSQGGPAGVKGALAAKAEGNLGLAGRGEVSSKKKIIRNYEPSRVLKQISIAPGKIKRLSVAVLVDENAVAGKDKQAKLEWIEKLVKGAVGYNPDRGDVVEVSTFPFRTEEVKGPAVWMEYASRLVKPLLEFLIAVLVLLLVIRPLLKSILEKKPTEAEIEALERGERAPEVEAREEAQPLPHEMALGIVQSSPERAAILVKKWLLEESAEERAKALKEAA